jgi:DASH complex subunit SPC19
MGGKNTVKQKPTKTQTQHYELIPQSTLQAAEASLRSELAPAIETLLDRADNHIDRIERRIESLKARSELQQGRLDNYTSTFSTTSAAASTKASSSRNEKKFLDEKAKARARALKQDREALQYSIERLELQVLQKERELRKRLDANT